MGTRYRSSVASLALSGLVACAPPAPGAPAAPAAAVASTKAEAIGPTLPPPPALPMLPLRHTSMAGCSHPQPAPTFVLGRMPEGAPLAVWEETLADAGCVAFARDEGVEVAGVVLDGAVALEREDGPAKIPLGQPWMAFRAPGGGVSLQTTVAKSRVLFVVSTTKGSPVAAHRAGKEWDTRRKRIDTVDFAKLPDFAWGGGAHHARIGWQKGTYEFGEADGAGPTKWQVDDAPSAVVDTLLFAAGAGVAEHVHPKEWECLVVLQGDGTLVQKKDGAETKTAIAPGVVACIPPSTPHQFVPGKSVLLAIQVYSPPGPEQRFVNLAEVKK